MRIVRVTKTEFELETGEIFPITPPLLEDLTIEEFQRHYDYASEVVRGCPKVGGDDTDDKELGQVR
jgi:hypothetical protein